VLARGERFARLGDAAAKYERGTELNEGLAQYVERRAAGRAVTLGEADTPAARVRQRAYDVGAAVAEVLTRLQPGWERSFDAADSSSAMPLDLALANALAPLRPQAGPCPAASTAERAAWTAQAGAEVRALAADRARARAEYLGQAGWRVAIEAADAPFFPQGFDPLNLMRVSPTEILHTRFLRLQGPAGSVELLSRASLTEGRSGGHPLFAGVARITVAGLPGAMTVRDSSGTVLLDAPGVHGRIRGARTDTSGQSIRIRVP
jgi:hypothetical protein